jgi:hypothetical protein
MKDNGNRSQVIEEPCEVKVSSTVLKTNGLREKIVEFNHCVDYGGEVSHVNYDDGFEHDWMDQSGNSPSDFKVTYDHSDGSPDTYAVKVFADEWH